MMADQGKKRKRNPDKISNTQKKVAVQAPPQIKDVTVSLIQDSSEWSPIVVSTPGLAIPENTVLQPYSRKKQIVGNRKTHPGSITANEFILQSSDHPKIDYIGRDENQGDSSSLLKHYVGVYDPATGDLRVMEARKMVVRGIVRSEAAAPEAFISRESTMNGRNQRNLLGEAFGTKKAKKAIQSLSLNAISPQNVARDTSLGSGERNKLDTIQSTLLDTMITATEGMATNQELSASIDAAKPRPVANSDAVVIEDVYPVKTLVGKEIMRNVQVHDWQQKLKANEEITTNSKYVSERLLKNKSETKKLKILRYILSLVEFYKAGRGNREKGRRLPKPEVLRSKMEDTPDEIFQHIRRKFSAGQGDMPRYQVDLLITHICALACTVDEWEVDLYDLTLDLQLETPVMQRYFREIGARVTSADEAQRTKLGLDKATGMQRKFAKLRLPLDFPKPSLGRRMR